MKSGFRFAVALLFAPLLPEQTFANGGERGPAMTTGAPVAPPGGFVLYCLNFPGECLARPLTPELIEFDGRALQTLDAVQAQVNAGTVPRRNRDGRWDYPSGGYGDCNSYALEKKRELVSVGLPRSALLLAVARTETGEGHLVLVARTTEGDLVLDNRVRRVLDWTRLPYRWVERQSETNPAMWLAIEAPDVPVSDAAAAMLFADFAACSGPGIE